jgi:DNA-binding IclR family transcriptional regulator
MEGLVAEGYVTYDGDAGSFQLTAAGERFLESTAAANT